MSNPSTTPAIHARGLEKHFGETHALRGIDLDVPEGKILAVLGPNGAGKTTFVKHAIGLLKPKVGRVLVNGRDTKEASVAQIAGTLGYVFQSPSHMLFAPTVNEELAFGPKNLKHSKEQIESTELAFNRYGQQYFLAEIISPAIYGEFSATSAETRLAEKQTCGAVRR